MLAAIALCAGATAGVRLHGPTNIPGDWTLTGGEVDMSVELPVIASVKMPEGAKYKLEEQVRLASTPGSPRYLRHLSWAEVGDIVRPPAGRTERVGQWLSDGGAQQVEVHPHGDSISAKVPLHRLQKLTGATFVNYQHADGRVIARATGGVDVPSDIADALDAFSGFTSFPLPKMQLVRSTVGQEVTPPDLMKAYGITTVKKSGKSNIQALAQFQGQYVDNNDLSYFCKQFAPSISANDCKIAKYIGKNEQGHAGVESMLDSEYMIGMGQGTPTWVFSYPNFDFCGDLIQWTGDVMKNSTFPWTISLSYGSQHIGFCESQLPQISTGITKLTAAGISIFASSGDDGSGHKTRQGTNNGKLAPSFLSSVTHACAVGSTKFESGISGSQESSAQFGSGGGFSYDFKISDASWQSSDVSGYLSKTQHPEGGLSFATDGRGTPDVSFLGEGFKVRASGRTEAVGGTSASSPSVAAIFSLLNEVCLTAGGTTIGFVNPFIYGSCDGCFDDITKGTSAIATNKDTGVWKAEVGWDACTGLGTPNFAKLVAATQKKCASAARRR